MKKTSWLDKEEYPFDTKTLDVGGYNMSYIDAGKGEVILFVHGTPSWSFEYRKIIHKLQANYRCIAPDHLGFGLSDKPEGIDYTPPGHAARLANFIDKLNLRKINLVVHDFGGPIGLAVAINKPERFQSIAIINTWLWSLNDYGHFTKPTKIIKSGIGKFLYEKLNFSANILLKSGFSDKKYLTKKIHSQYKLAQDKRARKAAYQLALSLTGQSDWYEGLWSQLERLRKIPVEIIWGMEDRLLPADILLQKWRKGFPEAAVHKIKGAGHFPHEENAGAVVDILENHIG